jgi:hypothetical protein
VGINLAIQDAVAAARLLAAPLREHRVTTADLARVQQRRQRPAVILQTMQRTLHLGIGPLLSCRIALRPPWGLVDLVSRAPRWMLWIPARLIAVGPRPSTRPTSPAAESHRLAWQWALKEYAGIEYAALPVEHRISPISVWGNRFQCRTAVDNFLPFCVRPTGSAGFAEMVNVCPPSAIDSSDESAGAAKNVTGVTSIAGRSPDHHWCNARVKTTRQFA